MQNKYVYSICSINYKISICISIIKVENYNVRLNTFENDSLITYLWKEEMFPVLFFLRQQSQINSMLDIY